VTRILSCGEDSLSVGFEEVPSQDWTESVYEPDILKKWNSLAKEPGYGPRPQRSEKSHGLTTGR
jgi:4-oxalocrotonate tautomerase